MLLLYCSSSEHCPIVRFIMRNGNLNICEAGVLIHIIPQQIVFFVVVADAVKDAKMVDFEG